MVKSFEDFCLFAKERIEGNYSEVIENNGVQNGMVKSFEDFCLFAKERIEGNNSEVIENGGVQMDWSSSRARIQN